jgi:SAM-dependent methyltransferase/glycosyltransferase involved in cell wall biosynthesis
VGRRGGNGRPKPDSGDRVRVAYCTLVPLRSLYVCYLSLEDPLVESQVVAYLEGLARIGHEIHLLTFETRRLTRARRCGLRRALRARGVHWHGLRYHKRPSLPATALDTLCGALTCATLVRHHRLDVIHARNHVPAAMAMLAAPLAPHRLIFDLRGLMGEEYIDAGRWRPGGLAFRITKRVEGAAIRQAEAVVVLTNRVRHALFGRQSRDGVVVIPCCADVDRIAAARARRQVKRDALAVGGRRVLVYVGKFGGWYSVGQLADFFVAARGAISDLHPLVVTQNDPAEVAQQFARRDITATECTITSIDHPRLGELLAAGDAAIALADPGPSTIASSPTKIGECLAAGLPIVATDIGDVKSLLRDSRTGVVLERLSNDEYWKAANELGALIADPETAQRCIATAREHLSLRTIGVPRYDALYRFVAGANGCPACGSSSRSPMRRYCEVGLVRCRACGLVYTSRRPSDHELFDWYATYPVEDQISPITVARLGELVRSFEPYRRLGTLLDVGAGSGHLLDAAAYAGWSTHAVEYGPRQRERLTALGHDLHAPLLERRDLNDGSFDVVVLQEVIEHMRDPVHELREVARVLRPGGLLYVTCPNFASLSRRLLGPRWRVVEYPEHLNYFTASSLRSLAARHGLREVMVATTGLSTRDIRAAVAPQPCASDGRRSVDEKIREAAVRYPAVASLRCAANAVLSTLELGDTLKGRYERA